jgi:hypothetical protein
MLKLGHLRREPRVVLFGRLKLGLLRAKLLGLLGGGASPMT